MKKKLLILAMALTSICTYAQDKEKRKMLDENTQIFYSVNTKNDLDGSYLIKDAASKVLWLKGSYVGNERKGNWYAYSGKKLQLCYNYDQRKLLFIDSLIFNKAEIKVITDDKEMADNARIPLLICPVDLYLTLLCQDVFLPAEAFDINGKAEIKMKAKIDNTGKAVYSVIYPVKNSIRELPVNFKTPEEFSLQWIPANYNGKNLPSEFTVSTILNNKNQNSDTYRRFRWN